jgi:hypothetical protein
VIIVGTQMGPPSPRAVEQTGSNIGGAHLKIQLSGRVVQGKHIGVDVLGDVITRPGRPEVAAWGLAWRWALAGVAHCASDHREKQQPLQQKQQR